MATSKLAYIGIGLVSVFVALTGVFKREIHGLGANGGGDIVFYSQTPVEFWFTIATLFIFGIVLIYIALIKSK